MFQVSKNQIKRKKRTAIAQMHVAVNRGPANIHAHCTFVDRHEWFLAFCKGIVDGEVVGFQVLGFKSEDRRPKTVDGRPKDLIYKL